MLRGGIFIDRDGVINDCPPNLSGDPSGYITNWEQFIFLPGAREAFCDMYEMNKSDPYPHRVFVVSNQSGISRENIKCNYDDVDFIFRNMKKEIFEYVRKRIDKPELHPYYVLADYKFCPHIDEDNCACRKPKPGMIWSFAVEHELDLSRSWMIGDSLSDMKAAWNAGIRKVLRVDTEAEYPDLNNIKPGVLKENKSEGFPVPDLRAAVKVIEAYDAYIKRVWGDRNGG